MTLAKHRMQDMVKWIVIFLIVIALTAAVITLFVKLDRQTETTRLGAELYQIGGVAEDGTVDGSDDTSIVLRNAVTVDGLKIELAEDAEVTYTLHFYDADGEYLSSSAAQTTDWNGSVPGTADTVRVEITPTADDDGVSLLELPGYAAQLTVTVNK